MTNTITVVSGRMHIKGAREKTRVLSYCGISLVNSACKKTKTRERETSTSKPPKTSELQLDPSQKPRAFQSPLFSLSRLISVTSINFKRFGRQLYDMIFRNSASSKVITQGHYNLKAKNTVSNSPLFQNPENGCWLFIFSLLCDTD